MLTFKHVFKTTLFFVMLPRLCNYFDWRKDLQNKHSRVNMLVKSDLLLHCMYD